MPDEKWKYDPYEREARRRSSDHEVFPRHQDSVGFVSFYEGTDIVGHLVYAAGRGDVEEVKALIAAGADVNGRLRSRDYVENGHTALTMASTKTENDCYRHLDIVKLLIAAGADVNAAHPAHHMTPLMYAARANGVSLVKALIAAGADVNADNVNADLIGITALMEAEKGGNVEVAAILLAAGARRPEKKNGSLLRWLKSKFVTTRGVNHSVMTKDQSVMTKDQGSDHDTEFTIMLHNPWKPDQIKEVGRVRGRFDAERRVEILDKQLSLEQRQDEHWRHILKEMK